MSRPLAHVPVLLSLYRGATWLVEPVAPLLMALRGAKEDRTRAGERRGRASLPHPAKPVIWLHGASIGELMSALPLATALRDRGFFILLTSGTRSSAGILDDRLANGSLGSDVAHQYVPLDFPRAVGRFLDHWQPALALFMEQEIWPNMLAGCTSRNLPSVLVNGRLSQRSFERWQKQASSARYLLNQFDLCLAQSAGDASRYAALGVDQVLQVGNLKISADPADCPPAEQETLLAMIGDRPVWLAASTHPGEEQIIGEVHRTLQETFPDLLTVIAPRHAERADEILSLLKDKGLSVAQRSVGANILPETDIYLADTFGELALLYACMPVALIGGSLVEIGGHNPVEAIAQNCAVITGPHISNFNEMYGAFGDGCLHVANSAELATTVTKLLSDPKQIAAQNEEAQATLATLSGALERVLAALAPYLTKMERR